MLQSKDPGWLNRLKKKQDLFKYFLQPAHIRAKDTETEVEGIEKDILYKWEHKESWGSNTHSRQNRL